MKKINVGIVGGAGYTGGELLRILLHHPAVNICFMHSSSHAGRRVTDVHRDLLGDTDLEFQEHFSDDDIDLLVLCSGHGHSTRFFAEHEVKPGLRIIDLSQDFRIESPGHFRPFVYGLPEAGTDLIREAQNIANPGCFATAIQLGLLPLAMEGALHHDVHVTAVTGSTGAGQTPTATSHFSWRNNNISVYKAFSHQHLHEIRQSMQRWQPGFREDIHFIPLRGNFTRGILATMYIESELSQGQAEDLFRAAYAHAPFVHVSPHNIDLKQVVNTNKGLVHVEKHGAQLLVITAIDNLLKGASGQAVQNMNLMMGLEETTGLQLKPIAF